MTPWAQAEVQRKFNASGGHVDLFAVPGHGHGDLLPAGLVATKNGGFRLLVYRNSIDES